MLFYIDFVKNIYYNRHKLTGKSCPFLADIFGDNSCGYFQKALKNSIKVLNYCENVYIALPRKCRRKHAQAFSECSALGGHAAVPFVCANKNYLNQRRLEICSKT